MAGTGTDAHHVPRGLEGVVVADTALGDVRGEEGFYHYRQYSAIDLARTRSLEDVVHLMVKGELPDARHSTTFAAELASHRELPAAVADLLVPLVATGAEPMEVLRTAVSALGAAAGWGPTLDLDRDQLIRQALHLCAVVPTILAAGYRRATGRPPVPPQADRGLAANYLWMLQGREPSADEVRALEQYLILTVDHGFNASTFTARVVASTGADLAAAICGAIGALSGPLHGGAPSRALETLDAIGVAEQARPWLEGAVRRGERIMGFGHRVYRTEDPRAVFLREVARRLDPVTAGLAAEIEATAVEVLADLKPGRRLYANVELYAGVVLQACGVPRNMFTPTFAVSRAVGWVAHVLEQAADNRLIRPSARYVGPSAPQLVPAA